VFKSLFQVHSGAPLPVEVAHSERLVRAGAAAGAAGQATEGSDDDADHMEKLFREMQQAGFTFTRGPGGIIFAREPDGMEGVSAGPGRLGTPEQLRRLGAHGASGRSYGPHALQDAMLDDGDLM
jgi:hypothetical protein